MLDVYSWMLNSFEIWNKEVTGHTSILASGRSDLKFWSAIAKYISKYILLIFGLNAIWNRFRFMVTYIMFDDILWNI